MRRISLGVATAALLVLPAHGDARERSLSARARSAIDARCADRDARARATEPERFARIFEAAEPHAVWRVAGARTLARIAHDPDIYSEVATVWRDGTSVATVAIAVRSLDFRAQTSYCFRSSGALARIDETSSGTTNIDRERLYANDAGAIVTRDSKVAALFPQPNFTVSPDVVPATPDVYPTVRALPFFALLAR